MNSKEFREKAILIIKFALLIFLIIKLYTNIGLAVSEALKYPSGSADFQWDSAKLFIMRLNPYKETLFHTYSSVAKQFEQYYGGVVCNQLPSMICLLIPWTIFGPVSAKLAWLISNVVFIFAVSFGLSITVFRSVKLLDKIIWNMLWICSIPLLITIEMGQHLPFAVAGFFISVIFAEKAYENSGINEYFKRVMLLLSGCFLAVSYFKYTVTFLTLLYFVYKKWWKPVIISAVIHIGLTVFSSFWIHSAIIDMVKDSLIISASTGTGGKYDLMALMGNGMPYKFTVLFLAIILLFLAFSRRNRDDNGFMALLFSFSLIMVYHRSYDYFVLIIPAFWFFIHLKENGNEMMIPEKIYILWILLGIWVIFFFNTLLKRIIPLGSEGWDLFNDIMTFSGLYMICGYFIYREIKPFIFIKSRETYE